MSTKSISILVQLTKDETRDLADTILFHLRDDDVIEVIRNWYKADPDVFRQFMESEFNDLDAKILQATSGDAVHRFDDMPASRPTSLLRTVNRINHRVI